MNTYNANSGYEMDPQLLTHFNHHLDSLFGVYSKLLPFRMDFAYRKTHSATDASAGMPCARRCCN